MKRWILLFFCCALLGTFIVPLMPLKSLAKSAPPVTPIPNSSDLDIVAATVTYEKDSDLLIFEQKVQGKVGQTLPTPAGNLDGAPVLGYVFPTTLKPVDVGFSDTEGVLALAVTSHPDFDDTPAWDENNDKNSANDGMILHPHWVVLVPDERVAGGLTVKQYSKDDKSVVIPPINPGLPMYIDSPGYSVILSDDSLKVLVPAQRVNHKTDFKYDAVTAYLQVNTSAENKPMLGVYQVYDNLSGNLSLPYAIKN